MSIVQPRTADKLTLIAARMARASPSLWEEFVRELGQFSSERAEQCVQAPPDKLVVFQGRAQQAVELHALFKEAVARATVLEDKLKERK